MRVLDVKVDCFDLKEAISAIRGLLDSPGLHQVVTVNPEFVVRAQHDREFKHVLNNAALSVADGVGVSLAAKKSFSRTTGVDLVKALASDSAFQQCRFFLFGGRRQVARKAARRLKKTEQGLNIVGALDGVDVKTGAQNNAVILKRIKEAKPHILLVALGSPKQEKWIYNNFGKLEGVRIALGVGGAFDFLAGRVPRAPYLVRISGLEWLWRLGLEPWRLPRIYKAAVVFPYLFIRERIKAFVQ